MSAADLVPSVEAIDFGDCVASVIHSRSVVISNPNASDVLVDSVLSSDPAFVPDESGPITIAAGGDLTVTVRFIAPVAGAYAATLTVASDDTPGDVVIDLSATGYTLPVDELSWTPPGDQVAGVAFDAEVTATDKYGNLVDPGEVELSAYAALPSGVSITEVKFDAGAYIELQNTGAGDVDTSGWRLVIGDDHRDLTRSNPVTWTLPDSVAPGEILLVHESHDLADPFYFGCEIGWEWNLNGWVALVDGNGSLIDLVIAGANLAGMAAPFDGGTVVFDEGWSGPGLPDYAAHFTAHSRKFGIDTDTAFGWDTYWDSRGTANPDMVVPLVTHHDLGMDPASTDGFNDGSWSGSLRVDTVCAAAILRAKAGSVTGEVELGITGTGLLEVGPASVDFGEVIVSDTAEALVELRNLGDQPLPIDAITVDHPDLGLRFDTASAIPPYRTARAVLSFTPSATGAMSGELDITCSASSPGAFSVTVAGSGIVGPHVGYAWSALGYQVAGQPFAVTLHAVDAFGNTIVSYAGEPLLSANRGGSPLLLTEFGTGTVRREIELANVSRGTVDVEGWQVVGSTSTTRINDVTVGGWALGGTLATGAVEYRDSDPSGDRYLGTYYNLSGGDYPFWVALLSPDGRIADCYVYEWEWDQMDGFAPEVDGRRLSLDGAWQGASDYRSTYEHHSRTGGIDTDSAGDWTIWSHHNLGTTWNLSLPMCDEIGLSPGTLGPLVAGTWTGSITVDAQTEAVQFHASGDGAYGGSGVFTVYGSASPPVIAEGDAVSVTMSEDGAPDAFELELTATDPDGDALSWLITADPDAGVASVTGAGTATVGYAPPANWSGTTAFTVTVADGTLWTDSIVVTVTVEPVNDVPDARDDSAETVTGQAVSIAILANDTDVEGDDLTPTIDTGPAHGNATVNAGAIDYQPADGFIGIDRIVYRIDDGAGGEDTAVVTIAVTTPAGPDVIRVDPAATGAGTGQSWAEAMTSLIDACAAAREGDEIWVVGGIHLPSATGDRWESFEIEDGVAVRGGFAGTEADPGERDPETGATILSGDLDGDDVDGAASGANSARVAVVRGGDPTALDRVTVQGALGSGGLYVYDGADLSLTDVHFIGNRGNLSGGGVYLSSGSTMALTRCRFTGNGLTNPHPSAGGAAIHAWGDLSAADCDFSGNVGAAGALLITGGSATFEDCTFTANQGQVAAMMLVDAAVTATRCVLADHADGADGVVLVDGGSLAMDACLVAANTTREYTIRATGTLSLEGCTVAGNRTLSYGPTHTTLAFEGGGQVSGSILWGNTRVGAGGTAAQYLGSPTITRSCVQGYTFPPEGIIASDPRFVNRFDPDGLDDVWATRDDGYLIAVSSPCIDLGDPATATAVDLTGTARGAATAPDLGAYDRGDDRGAGGIPIADAGPDLEADVGYPLSLDASASSDPDGLPLPLAYRWQQVDGPGTLAFDDDLAVDAEVVADVPGTYTISLVVSDGDGSDQDTFSLSVIGGRGISLRILDEVGEPVPTACSLVEPVGTVTLHGGWTRFRRLPATDHSVLVGVPPSGDG